VTFQYFVLMPFTTYTWQFSGGVPSSATGAGPHTVIYPYAGTYPVQLTIANQQGTTVCMDSIKVMPLPVASITQSGNTLFAQPPGMAYQWYLAPPSPANLIPGATSQFFNPQSEGLLCVVVSNALGCKDTACIDFIPQSIYEAEWATPIQVFPNPTSGRVTIELGGDYNDLEVIVTDVTGRVMLSRQYLRASSIPIELDGNAGLHFIKLNDRDGRQAVLKVILK
jgi:PKD repeat protein